MKQFYFFLLALMSFGVSFGQILVDETLRNGSLPSGWSQTDVTFITTARGYAHFTSLDAILTTPTFDASANTTVDVSFAVAKFGSGGNGPITVEYSLDGGTNWTTQGNSTIPTNSTYENNTINIPTSSATMQIKFTRINSPSQKRLRDVIIQGVGAGSCIAPSEQASGLAFTNITASSIDVSFTAASPATDNYLIVRSTSSTLSTNPIDTTSYMVSETFGNGVVVFNGSSTSFTDSGLIQDTQYYYFVFAHNNEDCSGGPLYRIPALTNGESTLSGPCLIEGFNAGTAAPLGWTFTGITGTYSSDGNFGNSSPSIRFNNTNDRVVTPTLSGPAASLSFWIKGQSTNATSALLVEGYDGANWIQVAEITNSIPTSGTTFTYDSTSAPSLPINLIQFRFTYTKDVGNLAFDDLEVFCGPAGPTVSLSETTLTSFIYAESSGPSAEQTFTAQGSNLTDNMIITAPTNFEVSLSSGSGFGPTVTLTQSSGSISTTSIYMRLAAGLPQNTYNGILTATSTGATAQDISVSGEVTALTPSLGWQITSENTEFVIDFDATVTGVNNGQFAGSGFTPSPSVGQLNSNAWAITGLNEGLLSFGDTQTSGDFSRGSNTGGVTTGGVYAFETSTGNLGLGVQPGGADFTPGTFTLRAQNKTGATVTRVDLEYLIYVLNDQNRGNSFNFSYSTDNSSYTDVPSLDYTSPEASDGSAEWVSNGQSNSITSINIPNDGFLYLRWTGDDVGGNGLRDEFALDDIKVIFNRSTTYTFDGSWSPINPNGLSTLSENIVIVSGNASISANTSAKNLTVNPGASLTVESMANLTVAELVSLESVSNNYSSLILNGTISGDLVYNRFVNQIGTSAGGGNDLVAPPLGGQPFNDFVTANGNLPQNTGGTQAAFAIFNNAAGNYVNFDPTATTALQIGTGYRAATDAGSTLTFSGTAATNMVDVDITVPSGAFGKWNLIGNPYPSYINTLNFLEHEVSAGVSNASLLDENARAIYGYNGGATGIWEIVTLANAAVDYPLLAPGQGFFVAAAGNATLQFTPAMRAAGNNDDFIAGRNTPLIYLKLQASKGTETTKTDIYFNDNAGNGLDPGYDAQTWGAQTNGFTLYSHLVADNNGVPMGLQALGMDALNNVSIPIGINAAAGTNLSFSILDAQLPTGTDVYLEDTANNTATLINNNNFNINLNEAVTGTGRFFLRVTSGTLSIGDENAYSLNIYHDAAAQSIVIAGQLSATTKAYLYDLQGRAVISNTLNTAQLEQRLDVSSLSSGVYVLSFDNGNTRISKKLIIK